MALDDHPRTESGLASRVAFLQAVLGSLVDPVFVLNVEGRYLGVFGASERGQYDSPHYLIGRTMHEVMPAPVADGFLADIRRVIETGQVHVTEYTLSGEQCDGNPLDGPRGLQWFQGRIARLTGDDPSATPSVAWVVVNITERKRLEAELERLALSDELTGLLNRRAFLGRAESALQQARMQGELGRLQLALVDLDHFKRINDRYGHLVGDAMLKHVSDVFAGALGAGALLARIGGEEFALLFAEHTPEQALQAMSQVRAALQAAPLPLGQERIAMDFSAGLCGADLADGHPVDLMRRADQFLYQAKSAGRARTCHPGWVDRRRG